MGHIRVSGLGKAYKQYPNRWSRLFEWMVPFSRTRHHLHWVLQGVDFEIQPGEAVGIVGVNGAGLNSVPNQAPSHMRIRKTTMTPPAIAANRFRVMT